MSALNKLTVTVVHKAIFNKLNLSRNENKPQRFLEIGPGIERIAGFETFNIISGSNTDYVGDAAKNLPFAAGKFDLVYASHILEHTPWYRLEETVADWARVIKPGGALEVWVPHGLKIAKAFVEAEETGSERFGQDNWWRFNDRHDPCLWMAGRTFAYGNGTAATDHPNWHRAMFSPRFLTSLLERAGLTNIQQLETSEVRGYDHGWINLGMRGIKAG